MSWQDDLKELDAALAAGQISADDYRTRRDSVLAQASGQSAGSPTPGAPQAEATQMIEVPPKLPAPPPPPPQRPGPPGDDRTQIVPPGQSGQQDAADRTQIVAGHDPSADSTQVVPNVAGDQQPRFPAPPPPPPWETMRPARRQPSPEVAAPPWANEELPPNFGMPSWPTQGPELFTEPDKSRTGKIIAIIAAVVVLLGAAGTAIWFFGFKNDNNDTAQTSNNPPPTTQRPSPTKPPPNIPKGPFIELPGSSVFNRTVPIADAVASKVPTDKEAALLQTNGVVQVSGLVFAESGLRRGIWGFQLGSAGDPKAALTAMDKLYEQAKFTLVPGQEGVLIRHSARSDPDANTTIRAHYLTSDNYLVRVEVYGKNAADVEAAFTSLLEDETTKFKPVT